MRAEGEARAIDGADAAAVPLLRVAARPVGREAQLRPVRQLAKVVVVALLRVRAPDVPEAQLLLLPRAAQHHQHARAGASALLVLLVVLLPWRRLLTEGGAAAGAKVVAVDVESAPAPPPKRVSCSRHYRPKRELICYVESIAIVAVKPGWSSKRRTCWRTPPHGAARARTLLVLSAHA